MFKIILCFLALIPTILGIGEIIQLIKLAVLRPKAKPKGYVVVFLERGLAFEQLKYAVTKYGWENSDFSKVVAIPKELEAEEYEECRNFAERYGVEFNKNVI